MDDDQELIDWLSDLAEQKNQPIERVIYDQLRSAMLRELALGRAEKTIQEG